MNPRGDALPGTTLTVRNLDEATKAQLRLQAARHGRSMEEVRTILREAFAGHPSPVGPVARGSVNGSMPISLRWVESSWSCPSAPRSRSRRILGPDRRRKADLQPRWDGLVADILAGRVWPFNSEAAHWYADLLRTRERLARPMATADAVIAATALAHGAQLATRDRADFADVGLDVINPWAG